MAADVENRSGTAVDAPTAFPDDSVALPHEAEEPLGSAILGGIELALRTYLVLPGDEFYDTLALWVMHTHAASAFDTTPRLVVKSPEKESGKTRVLEVLELLVRAPLPVFSATPAAIFRLLAEGPATVLLDEADVIWSPRAGSTADDLRALINAGYRRGAAVARVVGEGKKMRVERFPAYAPVALACIGDLPDTIESRSVKLPMRRRAPDETVQPFRQRRAKEQLSAPRVAAEHWAGANIAALEAADPSMPPGISDRAADCWAPLLAVADVAGGEWPHKARNAARALVKGRVDEDRSTGVRLIADIKGVLNGHDRVSSAELCNALNALPEAQWGGWNAGKGIGQRDLARRLKQYHVESKNVRTHDGSVAKGYLVADLADPFARYLRHTSATSATSATGIRIDVAAVADVAQQKGATAEEELV